MTTEQYSIGYDAGYQDGFDAALAEPVKQEPVAWVNAERNTITWEKIYPNMEPLYADPVSAKMQEDCTLAAVLAEREALAEQEKQEPVAIVTTRFSDNYLAWDKAIPPAGTKLYAAPVYAPKQEPVAWVTAEETFCGYPKLMFGETPKPDWIPLYAAPVSVEAAVLAERERVWGENDWGEAAEWIRQQEREACAEACLKTGIKHPEQTGQEACAAAIRARIDHAAS